MDCEVSCTQVCRVLEDHDITIASPNEKQSLPSFLNRLDNVSKDLIPFEEVNMEQYAGIILPSGESGMEILHKNETLKTIILNTLETQS